MGRGEGGRLEVEDLGWLVFIIGLGLMVVAAVASRRAVDGALSEKADALMDYSFYIALVGMALVGMGLIFVAI